MNEVTTKEISNEPGGDGSRQIIKTQLKLLRELKLTTEGDVARMLNDTSPCVDGWQLFAETCDMDKKYFNEVGSVRNPGKAVIEYLSAAEPNMTVHRFCKIAQEIGRDDIVAMLEEDVWTCSPAASRPISTDTLRMLADIDGSTKHDVEHLLNKDIIGVGDHVLIAEEYEMSKQEIVDIGRRKNPGKHLFQYLKKRRPHIHVEDFANVLAGQKLKRRDIAERLRTEILDKGTVAKKQECSGNEHKLKGTKKEQKRISTFEPNQASFMKTLLRQEMDVNLCNKHGQTSLHIGVAKGCDRTMKTLLIKGADVHQTDKFLRTPLQIARRIGSDKNTGDSPLEAVMPKYTPESLKSMKSLMSMVLELATRNGNDRMVEQLIQHGVIDVDLATTCTDASRDRNSDNPKGATNIAKILQNLVRGTSNMSPLHKAVAGGKLAKVVAIVLDRGDEHVDSVASVDMTPLHRASAKGDHEMVEVLVRLGATIDSRATNALTPLHLACFLNNSHVVQVLVNSGADIRASDSKGYTILHAAAQNRWAARLLRFILWQENRPDVNVRDKEGFTPIHRACQRGHRHVVHELLESGADLSVQDNKGAFPIHLAAKYGHSKAVKVLLETSTSTIELLNQAGLAPLHLAVLCESIATVEVLLNGGANINAPTKYSMGDSGLLHDATALHLACKTGKKKMVSLLLEKGADHTMQAVGGNTALHIAVIFGYNKCVKCLLKGGANIAAETATGMTPLALAEERGMEDMLRILREAINRPQRVSPQTAAGRAPVKGGQSISPAMSCRHIGGDCIM